MPSTEHFSSSQFPVSVIMERHDVQRGRWADVEWRVVGVVAGERVNQGRYAQRRIHAEVGRKQYKQYLCTGYLLELFKDAAETYYHNLMGESPSLFVVCYADDEEKEVLAPALVTASQDEATAHMEGDDLVLSAPMPPEIHQWLERYVVEHYVPPEKKKRKRKNWTEETQREP